MSEFAKRLAVTLAALAIYRLGAHLPLAGIDPAGLATLYSTSGASLATDRISIFALGVTPIISVLLLVEVARLVCAPFNRWADAAPGNARRLERYALIGALLLAAVQGLSVADGLEAVGHLVTHPGPQFRIGVMATFVAATALLVWLAALISRHGLGNGLWMLLLAPHLAGLPGLAASLIGAVQTGVLPANSVLAAGLYPIVAVAAIVALARPVSSAAVPLDRALIWPLFIAGWLGGLLLAVPLLMPAGPAQETAAKILGWESPFYFVALAAIAILVSLAQWRRLLPRGPSPEVADDSPVALTALALAALTIVPQILIAYLGLPVLIDGRMIAAMVIVALSIQALMQGRED